ncbi:AP2 domain protein [Roseivivax jejudonensis]|uniref:AP2 domain protein n=2 Tax=Roseivivax jejudonensis TaxID=1529041 RepID=A0A1X7AAP3_9RHOB|nr:AP2 domain protein [Roseivivax jejudonensis]
MAKKPLPCPTVLRQLLDYNPETGVLTWKHRPTWVYKPKKVSPQTRANRWNATWSGKPALNLVRSGYKGGSIFSVTVEAQRVAWAIYYGEWPSDRHIDHINGDPTDNRICNLRLATRSQNNQNVRSAKGSSSRYKGVAWDKSRGKWTAGIKHNYKRHNLGRFDCEEEAARAHDAAALRIYGEYAKLNFPPAPL